MPQGKEVIRRKIERWGNLKRKRDMWLLHWEDLTRLELPRRTGFVTQMTEGERRTEEIYDNTAMRSARGLANAVGSLLRPEGEKWFKIGAEEDRLNQMAKVQDWIHLVEDRLLSEMYKPKARFRQAVGEGDMDLVVLGTAVMFIGKQTNVNRLKFLNLDLKDVVIALNADNIPDTVFQSPKFSLRNAEERFGKENLSPEVRQRLEFRNEANLDEKIDFLRIVEPRRLGREGALVSRNFLYTDTWIEINTQHEVANGGFREFPFVIPRWDTSTGETYGRSPGMIALPNAETLNAQTETILISGQKAADPSVFAPNDSSFDAINSFSGGITYYDVDTAIQMRGNPFFTLDTGFNLPITRDMQNDERAQVEAAFFKNVFNLPIQGPEMTATEVIARKEEFIREVGATFGRLESDYLAPSVERSFVLLLRMGEFDPIPEELVDREINFEYKSPVKRMRDQIDAAAARLWYQELLEMKELKENIVDIANLDEIARHSARALDLPPIMVNSREQVEEDRAKRLQEEEEIKQRAKVEQDFDIGVKGAKGLKDASEALGGPEVAGEALQGILEQSQ